MLLPLSYHLQNLRVRRLTTALTLGGLALVIFVFVIVMGLAQGLTHLFVSTGAHDNLLFIRKGASTPAVSSLTEDVLPAVRYLPEVKRGAQGEPLVSAELIENLSIPTGHGELPARRADAAHFDHGRHPRRGSARVSDPSRDPDGSRRPPAGPGAAEVMVGRGLARQMRNVSVGSTLALGRGTWTIVGVFESGGSAYESEIWTDRRALMADRMRSDFSFIVATVDRPTAEATAALGRVFETNPALSSTVRVVTERRY